jgi:putative endonuclease
LLRQGLTIVGRNVRVSRLEIDLIAIDGDCVVIVEVRTRGPGSWVGAFGSVGGRKQRRLRAAGESLWRTRFQRDPRLMRMRFDVVAVHLDGRDEPVEHARAAF